MGWGVYDYPEPPKEPPAPVCPVCGNECSTYYTDIYGDTVGCEHCIRAEEAE